MIRRKIAICMICMVAFVLLYSGILLYQSKKYPAPGIESVEQGEYIEYDEYKYKVIESGYVEDEKVQELWETDIESLGEIRVVYVKIEFERIKEKTDGSRIIQLSDFTLVTDTYNQAPDLVRYTYFNSSEELVKTHDNIGDSKQICLVFTIPKAQFTNKQWENMSVNDFRIHISRYPVIKEIRINEKS